MILYSKFNKLIIISKTVLEYYEQLLMLELENKKDNEEFDKEFSTLQQFIEYEERLLSELTPNEWSLFIIYLSEKIISISNAINDNIDVALSDNGNLLAYQRLLNKLRNKHIKNLSEPLKHAHPEDYECDSEDELEKFKRITEGTSMLYQTLQEDEALLLFKLLQQEVDDIQDLNTKNKLIKFKYNLIATYPSLEQRFIENKLSKEEKIYFSSDLVSAFYRLSSSVLFHVKSDFSNQIYIACVEKLLSIKNEEYEKENIEVLVRSLLLRVTFQLLDEDQIKKVHDLFLQTLENNSFLIGFEKGIETIENAFKKYQTDRKLINKVTLG